MNATTNAATKKIEVKIKRLEKIETTGWRGEVNG
jgi:hypothetical protein